MQPRRRDLLFLLLLPLLFAACGSTPKDGGPGDAQASAPAAPHLTRPWPRAFLEPAFLVADEITIEGPPALRDHLVVRQDVHSTTYTAKTTKRGLLQETVAKPNRGLVEIRAQLDGWQLVAFRRITWLERPGDTDVTLRATGDAKWGTEAGDSREGPVLEFRGGRAR